MKPLNLPKIKKKLDREWSLAVRNRDNYICQKCGVKSKNVHAAHIFSRNNQSTRWIKENGVALCFYCHLYWAHRSPVEFTIWVKEKIGEKNFKELEKKARKTLTSSELRQQHEEIVEQLR